MADALAAKKPFVLIFATPKFCKSAQCGPTLDQLKPVAAAHPELTFINVEPYELKLVDGQLQPVLTPAISLTSATDATNEWGLLASRGSSSSTATASCSGSFELIASPAEIDAAIKAISPAGSAPAGRARRASGASSSRTALQRRRSRRGTRRGPGSPSRLVLGEVAGRELDRVLERRRSESRPSGRRRSRSVKPRTLVRLVGLDGDDDAGLRRASCRGGRAARSRRAARRRADRDRDQPERCEASEDVPGRVRVARGQPPRHAPVPLLPGAWSGVPSAQRGQVAGPGS